LETPSGIAARLVRESQEHEPEHAWSERVRDLLAAEQGFTRVLGSAGTGKTSLLVELATHRIRQAADPGRVLVLTGSRGAAESMRGAITRRLALRTDDALPTVREPLVRTVHSYAF